MVAESSGGWGKNGQERSSQGWLASEFMSQYLETLSVAIRRAAALALLGRTAPALEQAQRPNREGAVLHTVKSFVTAVGENFAQS